MRLIVRDLTIRNDIIVKSEKFATTQALFSVLGFRFYSQAEFNFKKNSLSY